MRTTVTLDPDLAARLRRLAAERRVPFKTALNATLRAGLEPGRAEGRPYREVTRDLGVQAGVDVVKALRLASELEDQESIRKLDLRK